MPQVMVMIEPTVDLSWERCGLVVGLRAEGYVGPDFMVVGNADSPHLAQLYNDGVFRIGLDLGRVEQMFAMVRQHDEPVGAGARRPLFRAIVQPGSAQAG